MASKRRTAGMRIATDVFPGAIDGVDTHVKHLARRIDAAIRREVRYAAVEAYWAGVEDARAKESRGRDMIRNEYGVLP